MSHGKRASAAYLSVIHRRCLGALYKKRDFVVHQGMLNVSSTGIAGTTEGRGIKMAVGFRVEPHESTVEAYEKFKFLLKKNKMATAKPRAFYSALFNMANAYNQAAELALGSIPKTGNADFAGPAIMCRSFAIELLLKFFIAVQYPDKKFKELKTAGINLRGHTYSSLFDRIEHTAQQVIADTYSKQSGNSIDVAGFRGLLIALGDEPFVTWRYIYEVDGTSQIDPMLLASVTRTLGLAAQGIVRAVRSKGP
jgi:hypothetical protein